MLMIDIWAFILSYLPLIDLLNMSACSKMFYHLVRDVSVFSVQDFMSGKGIFLIF